MGLGADRVLALGIEDNQVGVAAHRNGSLAGVEAKEFGGCGCDQFNKAIHAEATLPNPARIYEAHAMFDPGTAIGDLSEVTDTQLFLLLEAKRAMIGRDHLQVVVFQPLPQLLLVPLFA